MIFIEKYFSKKKCCQYKNDVKKLLEKSLIKKRFRLIKFKKIFFFANLETDVTGEFVLAKPRKASSDLIFIFSRSRKLFKDQIFGTHWQKKIIEFTLAKIFFSP